MENVGGLMASSLTPESLAAVRAVGTAAEDAGVLPYLVGGSVRDLTLGHADAVDIDITLVGADATALSRLAELTGGQIARRSQFVTAKLRLGTLEADLAMARAEEYPAPGSLPVVRPGTLDEDLSRRDFSVNAMAVSLSSETWGDLVDLHQGLTDLLDRRLRTLHENSFRDDPTRILRAARYASRLALTPTSVTVNSLLESVTFLDCVSPARVRNEMGRVFQENKPSGAMQLLSHWGVLRAIHSCLEYRADAWDRFAAEVKGLASRDKTSLGYAILSCGISEADSRGLITRLNPGAPERRSIQEAATLGRMSTHDLETCSNSGLAEILDPLCEPALLGVALVKGGELGCRISRYLRFQRSLRPYLTGDSLIAMGVPRGPEVGEILNRLRNSWLDGEVSNADEERALAESLVGELSVS